MSNNRPHIKNLKSKSTIMDGQVEQPRPPEADDLLYGEIAMNYKSGMETLYIKNDTDEIVGFKSSEQTESEIEEIRQTISDDELVISSALNDLNDRIIDESEERSNADNEISQRLGNEITNRESADRILKSDVMSVINNLEAEIPSPDGTTITMDNDGNFKVNTHEGFLIDENGINVAVGSSLTTESGDIEVKPGDDTIIVDINGVSVNVNDEGGIGYDSNGLYVRTGDGLTVDTDRVKVNTPSNSGLTVDSNGVAVNKGDGLDLTNNVLSLKTASTTEIGGVAIHEVHTTLSYEYKPIIGYTNDDENVITEDAYNALTEEEKEDYREVYGDWTEITEEEYNALPYKDVPSLARIVTDNLTFNDGDGNFGVNINDADDKAYVSVPIAGESGKYGLVKVGYTNADHGLNGIKIDRNNGRLAVDYDENCLGLINGGVTLTLKSSVIAQLKTYYDVILYMKVLSVDVSTGDITFDNTTLNFVAYNPNDYTVSQIIAGLVNGTITTKVIVDFSTVNSNMVAKFPKIWETTMNYTGMGDIFGIYNTIFPFLDNSLTPSTSPYIKLENVGVDAQGRFQASTKVLMNHTGWTV